MGVGRRLLHLKRPSRILRARDGRKDRTIDAVRSFVFLLAYASGPYFFGLPEERWFSAGAALDSSDDQIFLRNFLRKLTPSAQGMPRVSSGDLIPGEQHFCLLLVSKGLAVQVREEDRMYFLLDQEIHQHMVESLATRGLVLRASAQQVGI